MPGVRIEQLYLLCSQGTASEEERWEFLQLMNDPRHAEIGRKLVQDALAAGSGNRPADQATIDAIANAIIHSDKRISARTPVHRVHFLKTAWFRYAAAMILLLAGAGALKYRITEPEKSIATTSTISESTIPAGGNKATLTLSDGRVIVLDSAANGSLASQGTTTILKLDNGKLAYHSNGGHSEILYNTVSTPYGGQYQLMLPDGTKVWLNAGSSIRFTTTFSKDRVVETTGELFFEVAADPRKPFIVKSARSTVEVLGTSFNVNDYLDEPAAKVSLMDGSVKVAGITVKPGQAYSSGKLSLTDLSRDLAWKNGLFNFENRPFAEVMRQLGRWYDLDILYEKGVPNLELWGQMGRNLPLKDVLKFLKDIGLNFRLDGNRLTILQ